MSKFKFEYIRCLFQSANRNQKIAAAMFIAAKFMFPLSAFVMWTSPAIAPAAIGLYASLVMGTFCLMLYDGVQRYYFKELTAPEVR
tara:strand:- start:34090 stop:34347 length:258 start_codon:yes stop_codon:yes gene_type:complete